ncbi:hypothetical protein DFJ74DRAFT_676303 [Hyaloraphidium curvatum]|nr:hypothetical protein DFJ74DRAFT_676303 [Hyaloraphidium curvatum]
MGSTPAAPTAPPAQETSAHNVSPAVDVAVSEAEGAEKRERSRYRHIPTRTMRSSEVKDIIQKQATERALNFAFRGALLGIGTVATLSYLSPWFARRPRTLKTIFGLTFPMVGFTIGGEHEALRLERQIALERSYVKVPGMLGFDNGDETPPEALDGPLVTRESLIEYVHANQYKILFSLWGTLVSSTLIVVFANKRMPMAQKLIYARLVGQGGALSAFVGLAAFGIKNVRRQTPEDLINQRHFDTEIYGSAKSKGLEEETPWARAERLCARVKADYERCLSENPERGCAEKEESFLTCAGAKLSPVEFKSWMTCARAIRTTGMFEGMKNCERYKKELWMAMETAKGIPT